MAPPRRSEAQLQWAANILAEVHGNVMAGARLANLPYATFQKMANAAKQAGLVSDAPPPPLIRIPKRNTYQPTPKKHGKAVRVFVWGDAHDSPNIPDKSRFTNAGKLAAELAPDYIVDIGDTMDLDSLSSHAFAGSVDDRNRPGFLTEVASLDEAIASFNDTAPPANETPRYHLNGNHEYRANRFEKTNPTTEGVYTLPIAQVFARYGFTEMAFREWLYIEGVGFTHAPINGLGKEIGGKFPDQMVAQEATHSVVWGHTHKSNRVNRPKFGIGNSVQVFNTGCFMPQGYIKDYAGMALTGWTYGCHELTLRDGQIESVRTWSELELRERFT